MPNIIEFGKNSATSEQEVLLQFDSFLVSICGWERIDIVTDTVTDRDYVYYSQGTEAGKYRDLYVRLRAYANYIDVYGYSWWGSSSNNSGELYDSSYTRIPVNGTAFDWYGFGDKDGFWLVVDDGSYYYSLFGGYFDTYYDASFDSLPTCVIGNIYNSYWYTDSRVYGYGAADNLSPNVSGTSRKYVTYVNIYNDMLLHSSPSDRDGTEYGHCPFVMYCTDNVSGYEVRGELRHVLWFSGAGLTSGDWYTISGTNYKYFIKRYSDDHTEGFGPIDTASGTQW